MATSQNGWPALSSDSPKLYTWKIPARNGHFEIRMRNGSAGFLLAFLALWFSEVIEKVAGKTLDDWGYAFRAIRDAADLSNHASGTAEDLNSAKHVLGRRGTFASWQVRRIHRFLLNRLKGCVRWGGDYQRRADEMHFEIVQTLELVEKRARRLMKYTRRGHRLIRANPTQKAVILR